MTRKQIDAMREARLWIGQVIVPLLGVGTVIATNPNVRTSARRFEKTGKEYIRNIFQKKETK